MGDAGWMGRLHSYGPFRGSFLSQAEIATIRAEGGLNEHLGRHRTLQVQSQISGWRSASRVAGHG